MLKRVCRWLCRPSAGVSAGVLLLLGCVVGVVLSSGIRGAVAYTNTTAFCVSCHEMDQLVHQEYRESAHFKNASGVRAGCPDCHVPRDLGGMVVRKIKAVGDIYHWILGSVDTPEKFEAKRLVLAERVWKDMMESNSRECRNCHDYKAMDFHKQTQRGREKMEEARDENKPCIECHKGLTHKNPEEDDDD